MIKGGIVVLDFGSQFTQLIARRLREMGVYSEIFPFDEPTDIIRIRKPKGIILSGGPNSVYEEGSPVRDVRELMEIAPVLGICYGMQLMSHQLGGMVEKSDKREYGMNVIQWHQEIRGARKGHRVWMSHGDVVKVPPPDFEIIADSSFGHPAVMKSDRAMAFQFHPEVAHTDGGKELLEAFVRDMCKAEMNWQGPHITQHLIEDASRVVPAGEDILCALSGGVDSTVVGTLLTQVFGPQRVYCVFVDTGLMRKNEFEEVMTSYKGLGLNITGVRAGAEFMKRLKDVEDPEKKRKIIGHTFIDIFKSQIPRLGDGKNNIKWLAQGTLYPDVIESISHRGSSVTIKTHHNVGGLPKDLGLNLIEPLRELFKDEVRLIGKELKVPEQLLWRHPFPGPGLAIRVLGAVNETDLHILKEADAIYVEELKKSGLYGKIWQAFAVLLPIKTVGVQGDARTYDRVIALRAVTSLDGMTADWFDFPGDFLRMVSNRITNEVRGVNRVVYDVTSKPPGTIEWE